MNYAMLLARSRPSPLPTITISQHPTDQTAVGGSAAFSVVASLSNSMTPTYQWQRGEVIASPTAWSNSTVPVKMDWRGIAYGNGVWVATAFGQHGLNPPSRAPVWRSADGGATWAVVPGLPDLGYSAVGFGAGKFLAIGQSGVIESTDGLNWSTLSTANPVSGAGWVSVFRGVGLCVAVGSALSEGVWTGHIITSVNGQSWSAANAGSLLNKQPKAIAYGDGMFCVVGTNDLLATSANGTTWQVSSALPNSGQWQSVAFGNGRFVASCAIGIAAAPSTSRHFIATSEDAISWTLRDTGVTPVHGNGQDGFPAVAFDGNVFAIVESLGSGRIYTSLDGITWLGPTYKPPQTFRAVGGGNGTFVAVGQGREIAGFTNDNNPRIIYSGESANWTNVAGSDSPTLSLSGLVVPDSGDKYRVVVSSPSAAAVTSNAATLTVPEPVITITQQPTSQTSSGGEATFNVAATVSDSSSLSYQWERRGVYTWAEGGSPMSRTNETASIAYGNGVFVAVSTGSEYATSSDGVTWTRRSLPDGMSWRVYFAGGQFVAVGNGTRIDTSPDGVTWTFRSSNAVGSTVNSMAYGDGAYILTAGQGGIARRSTNLSSWASTNLPNSRSWNAVAFGQGLFVAVSSGLSGLSSDLAAISNTGGQFWSASTLPSASQWNSVAYGNGIFVAIGQGISAASSDGIAWTQGSLPSSGDHYVEYGDGRFVAVRRNSSDAAVSLDGVSWRPMTLSSSSLWEDVAYGGGKFVSVGPPNRSSNSQQAAWVPIQSGATSTSLSLSGLSSGSDSGDQFRAVVSAPYAASVASDAATLTVPKTVVSITTQPTSQTASGGSATFTALASVSPVGSPIYQWQRSDFVPAGETWTQRTMPGIGWLSIAHGYGTFVAVAYQSNRAATSSDGITWTQRTLPSNAFWRSVSYGGYRFVAVALGGAIAATSEDGITWTQQTLPVSADWTCVGYGNGTFVAAAAGSDVAATSPDGVTWTQRTLPSSDQWYSIAYGGGTFVATSVGKVATSPDGVTWTQRSMPVSASWVSVSYGNGTFVAVAYQSNRAATSSDGITWTERTLPFAADLQSVSYGNGVFVAVSYGSNVAATSSDGITWTQRTLPVSSNWFAVASGGGKFVAVTTLSIAASSEPYSTAFSNIPGETSSSLALVGLTAANDQDQYRTVVSAVDADSVTSDAATLTVP